MPEPSGYWVEIDNVGERVYAMSLAEVANKIRGRGKHFRVWSECGLLILDTAFRDVYELVVKPNLALFDEKLSNHPRYRF